MVTYPRQVFDPAAANQHDRVLLQVMTHPRDIRGHLDTVGQTHPGDLTQRRVRFFRRRSIDAGANAALLRAPLERWRGVFRSLFFSAVAHQLTDRRHMNPFGILKFKNYPPYAADAG